MIGQGATHTHSSSSPPLPPHPNLVGLAGDANIDMLACSPKFDGFASPLPSGTDDSRRASAKAPHPSEILKCPRCDSLDTKFCYYNNYSLTQPRYFCKNCKRYWTAGGALRNVPVGGGLRKNKRSKLKLAAEAEAALAAQAMASSGMQQQPKAGALGVVAVGEASQKLDSRTAVPANAAMPSHVAVGIPEMGMYAHPSRGGGAPRNYGERMLDHNSTGAVVNQQEGDFYSRSVDKGTGSNYFVEPGHVPQFYSSYAASLQVHQYGNPVAGGVESSGYAPNYNFLPPSENATANVVEAPNEGDASITKLAYRGAAKQEKGAEAAGTNPYDWQLISEGLLSSGGSTAADGSFFYMPSSGWPDFSQFNDTGPG